MFPTLAVHLPLPLGDLLLFGFMTAAVIAAFVSFVRYIAAVEVIPPPVPGDMESFKPTVTTIGGPFGGMRSTDR